MDCVRASDFPGGTDEIADMPVVSALRRESVLFSRAATVAPWTIPSHASLFTGLYPWEHGDHGRRSLALDPTVPRLPELLRPLGYRSASFSANALICPATGLGTGFDVAEWGSMFDLFLRLDHTREPPHTSSTNNGGDSPRRGLRQRILRRLPYDELPIRAELERHVAVPAVGALLADRLRGCEQDDAYDVARWIEPSMERFLGAVPPAAPVYCFVNLLDAHEPYFPDAPTVARRGGWRRYVALRQDKAGWLADPDPASGWDLGYLHDLYRSAIQRLDRRIGGLVDGFRRAGRWDNTLLVLTSDHGQAFGENGMLYHRFRVDESMIRIPMLVRFPGGEAGGRKSASWTSLVDVVPTCLHLAQEAPPVGFSGLPLRNLVDSPRPGPVFAVSDGTIGERWLPSSRKVELDRLAIAAYLGDTKLVFEAGPEEIHSYDLSRDPAARSDREGIPNTADPELVEGARSIGRRMEEIPREATASAVSVRLKSWGYI